MMSRVLPLVIALSVMCQTLVAQNWDARALQRVNGWDTPFANKYNEVMSHSIYAVGTAVPVAIGLASLIKRDRELMSDAIYIGTTMAEAAVLTFSAKEIAGRERPFDRWPGMIVQREQVGSYSFPSGHTAMAFSLATSLSLRYPKWYVIVPSALWATSVGISRMQRGVHYPSDVISGALIGVGVAFVNVYVNKWLDRLIFPEKRKPRFFTR